MKQFTEQEIDSMEYLYRINLINSCSGFKSANLIGTIDDNGITNVAVFSSVIHMGSNPPLFGFILRPTTVARHTYDNLKNNRTFTINHVYKDIIEDAHHTSAKYDKGVSEFSKTALEEEFKNNCIAPFVKGSPVQMEMEYVEEYNIESNGTILVIGKIKKLYVNEESIEEDGLVNLSKSNVVTINGLDTYCTTALEKRLDYQRPK
jgi:flavin reductase (DIM6/NTAB) family NADH-FMN oxidoreductase RutF